MANITSRVIDSQTNCPVADMIVMLRCFSHQTESNEDTFRGRTTLNGQVNHWSLVSEDKEYTLHDFFQAVVRGQESRWQICFNSVTYFGRANTYWSVIDINIQITTNKPHHVSLLLGPNDYRSFLTLGHVDKAPLPRELSNSECVDATHKPKRLFSTEERVELMRHYSDKHYPSSEVYDQIARRLHVDRAKVMRWYWARQHRFRQRQKVSAEMRPVCHPASL
jgi:5-hydroxyisourate hydrolase-like protein (transthyretin family)